MRRFASIPDLVGREDRRLVYNDERRARRLRVPIPSPFEAATAR